MTEALHEVAEVVLRESGMVIRESQLPALQAAIRRVAPGMTAEKILADMAKPASRGAAVERLIDEVTIKETYFLRHREELEGIDWRMLAANAMAAGRSSVRVWSAACASGEEAYSLAILALEAFAPRHPPVDILATDIATSSIERARAGRYGWRSVRHVDDSLRDRWFTRRRDGLCVADVARGLVRFERHNLLSDPVPPLGERPFDLVVCRNVLIYFLPPTVQATITRLQGALVPGGQLLLGAADRLTGGPLPGAAPAERPQRGLAKGKAKARPARSRPRAGASRPRSQPVPAATAPAASPATAEAEFERGLTALSEAESDAAVEAFRRALYLEPTHAPAAFQLARAHDARGDVPAARRAYWQALALLEDAGEEVGGVARRDLESAARARLDALGGS